MKKSTTGLSTFALKYIALLSMTLDHFGAIFLPYGTLLYQIVRGIGRIAFPVFCFLLVEGFFYTSNRQAYFRRLLLFAFLSEIPFDMAFYHFPQVTDPSILFGHQNVFFTLVLGFLALCLLEKCWWNNFFQRTLIIVGFCILAEILHTDYSFVGIMVILLFYGIKKNGLIYHGRSRVPEQVLTISYPVLLLLIAYGNLFVSLAIPVLLLYNGKKGSPLPNGRSFPGAKYLFYWYYPVHLFIFALAYFLLPP